MRTRLRSFGLPEAALLVVFGVAWVLIARQGMRNHVLQPDEALPVLGSRYLGEHFPDALFSSGPSGRGIERGLQYVFALVQWLVASTPAVFKGMHIIVAGTCASVALVVWAWARELRLGRWTAVGVGACAVALPWSVFGITFLNAAAAQAATPLALYACWRAIVRPSPSRDVAALIALLVLGLVRVGNLVVVLAVPIAVVVVTLGDRAPGVPLRSAVMGLPGRIWREHPVWVVAGAAAVLELALGGAHRLVGDYPLRSPLGDSVKAETRVALGQIGAGVALIPAAIAGAWAVRSVLFPRDRDGAALATLLLFAFAALCYAAATQGPEERYVAAVAPVLVLAFAVALRRREAGVAGTLVAALVVGREVVLHGLPLVGLPFGALGSPGTTFFQRVAVGKASLWLPVGERHPATSLAMLAGVGAVVLVLLARRRAALATGAGLAALALYGGAAGLYAMDKYVTGAGYPGLSYAAQAWVDGKVGSDADVGVLFDPAVDGGSEAIFREVRLFNRSTGLRLDVRLADIADPATGRVHGEVPPYVVELPRPRPLGLAEHQIASTSYLPQPLVLNEVEQPVRLAWAQQPSPRNTIVVRFFGAPAGRCAVIGFVAPPGSTGKRRFALDAAAVRQRGVLTGVTPVSATAALPPRQTIDARVRISGGGQLTQVGVTPC